MFNEVLETCISAIVEGLEDFFNVVTYPSRKYIKTALFVACGFLVMSLAGLLLGMFVFVNWYEVITAIVILLIIYFVSDISGKQVQDVANKMVTKTSKAIADTRRQVVSGKKKPVKKKPNKSKR